MKRIFNRPIRILLATNALILATGALIGPIYALFVEEIGGDLLGAGLSAAVFSLTAGIVTLVSGRYSDKVKENELIVVAGYLIMAIGFFGFLLVGSIWSLLIVQVIVGFGEAIYAPAFDALYSKHQDKRKAGRTWGAWETTYYFVRALGALAGGIIATAFGFNGIFVLMGTLSLISALYILRLPRRVL